MAQTDPKLSAIIDKMIAAGESDADIGAVIQAYQKQQGPTLGKQVKDFVTELGGGLGKQVYESTPFAHTSEAWEQVKKIPDLLRHPIDTFKRESEASAQQGRATLDLFRHPADTGAALAQGAEESLVGNDEMTLGGRVGRTLSNVLPFVMGGAGIRAGSLSRAARAAKVAEEAEKATLAEKAAQEAASMAGLRQKGEARAAAKFAEEEALRKLRSSGGPAEGSTTGTSPVGPVNAPVDQPFTVAPPTSTPLNIRITVPPEEGLAGATRVGAGRMDRAAGISDAVPSVTPVVEPPTVAANAAAKAEIDAEGGLHMPERRGSERLRSEVEDKAYEQVRREQERRAALARAKATLTPKIPATPLIAIKDDAELPSLVSEGAKVEFPAKSVGSAAKTDLPPLGGKMAEGPTVGLPEMVEKYGPEEAARRAGMSVDELHARVASGGDPEKLAQLLRERLGAEKAGRALGMAPDEVRDASGGGPSKLPSRAVEAIKATIARKEAAGEPLTSQDHALLDRIKREGGFSTLKTLAPIALGGGGAAYGYARDAPDEDTREGNALLGAGGGMAAGWALTHPRQAAKIYQHLRIESMLSGAAIPKNIMNYIGAPFQAAITGVPQTQGRWAAAREMFLNPSENLKNFSAAFTRPGLQTKYGAPAGFITRAIGAGDTAATKALQRAGMGQGDIERLLLTKNRNLFPASQGISAKAKKALDFFYPFQRVPWNVFIEGAEDVGHALFTRPDMRTAMSLAQIGGGYALGKWAKGNKKRQFLGQIALALLGPGTAIGTAGAMAGSGAGGNFGWGGISPIPEETLDLKSLSGLPPGFIRAYRKMKGQ